MDLKCAFAQPLSRDFREKVVSLARYCPRGQVVRPKLDTSYMLPTPALRKIDFSLRMKIAERVIARAAMGCLVKGIGLSCGPDPPLPPKAAADGGSLMGSVAAGPHVWQAGSSEALEEGHCRLDIVRGMIDDILRATRMHVRPFEGVEAWAMAIRCHFQLSYG